MNEYVSHYEPLDYDAEAVSVQHSRSRRSTGTEESSHVDLQFHSHGKPFRLRLKRDTSIFSENVEVVSHHGKPLDVDLSHFYEGHLLGKDNISTFVWPLSISGLKDVRDSIKCCHQSFI